MNESVYLMLRYFVYEIRPSTAAKQIPIIALHLASEIYWVPQTLGEQVWHIFKFKNENIKNEFINFLPENLKLMIDENLTQESYKSWCIDSPKWFSPENRIDKLK